MARTGLLLLSSALATSVALKTRPVSKNQLGSAAPSTLPPPSTLGNGRFRRSSEMRPSILTRPTGRMQRPDPDVTLVTQSTLSRVHAFETALLSWGGPASVVFYLEDEDQVTKLKHISSGWHETIVQYVLAMKGELYPVNALRNMALDAAETEYVFLLDSDFVSDKKAYESIRLHLPGDREALVVPAFELGKTGFDPESMRSKDQPADKEGLARLVKEGLAREFHKNVGFHRPTSFTRWMWDDEEGTYIIPSSRLIDNFEPYVVVRKASLPRYDERFVGRGYNKVSFCYALQCMGFQFKVLKNHFVAHFPHKVHHHHHQPKKDPNRDLWEKFKDELKSSGQCEPLVRRDNNHNGRSRLGGRGRVGRRVESL